MTWPPPTHTAQVVTYAVPLLSATPYGAESPPATVSCTLAPGVTFTSEPIGAAGRNSQQAVGGDLDRVQRSIPREGQIGQVSESGGVHRGLLARHDTPDVGVTLLEREAGQLADVVRAVWPLDH